MAWKWDHIKNFVDVRRTGLAVILSYPSGICYSTQTGGVGCNTRLHEGIYVPMRRYYHECDKGPKDHQEFLDRYFAGEPYWGRCTAGISDEDADFLDNEFFAKYPGVDLFRVDRDKLNESEEAWIYIHILDDPHKILGNYKDFKPTSGVLTWYNSD